MDGCLAQVRGYATTQRTRGLRDWKRECKVRFESETENKILKSPRFICTQTVPVYTHESPLRKVNWRSKDLLEIYFSTSRDRESRTIVRLASSPSHRSFFDPLIIETVNRMLCSNFEEQEIWLIFSETRFANCRLF